MRETDILIVGQGITGSLVAFMLHKKKIPFLVIDPGYANSASLVAAGMFTPVSGKRKTISPIILQQIPFAVTIYKEIEKLLGKNILHIKNIYELPVSMQEENEFIKKISNDGFAKFVFPGFEKLLNIKQDLKAFETINSGWVDCALFANSFKDWLRKNNTLIEEQFNYEELTIGNEYMQYRKISCKKIIFCEGYRALNNPFFNNENIIPCKGDILTIKYKDGPVDCIVKKDSCYLIPLGNNIFKAGSTYRWHNDNENLDETSKKEIESKLNAMLENEYTVVNHQTAIRPTTKNREVIARQHSTCHNMFMLNGMGTKGVVQSPWWANYMVQLLIK